MQTKRIEAMKNVMNAVYVSMVLALIPIRPADMVLFVLYCVVGVLYSGVMSLIVTFNGSRIANREIRERIKRNLYIVRSSYFFVFLFCSLFFVVLSSLREEWKQMYIAAYGNIHICWSFAMFVLAYLVYSIIVLAVNYAKVQQLYEDIEEQIHYENEKYGNK